MKFSSLLRQSPRFYMTVATLGALAACMGEETTTVHIGSGGPLPVVTITFIGGSGQSGVVRTALGDSLVVLVASPTGQPDGGASITWSTTASGGALSPPLSVTNAQGIAKTRWTLGQQVGVQSACAFTSAAQGQVCTTAIATVGPAATILKISGDLQTGVINTNVKDSMKVQVVDAFGNFVKNTTVRWLVTDTLDLGTQLPTIPGKIPFSLTATDTIGLQTFSLDATRPASPSFDSTSTDANGYAANRLVAGPIVGIQHLVASVQGVTSQTFQVTVNPSAAIKAPTNPPHRQRELPFMLFTVAVGGGVGSRLFKRLRGRIGSLR